MKTWKADRLEEAVEVWRRNPPVEHLSSASRSRILAAAHRAPGPAEQHALGSVFLTWRMALAGAVPVALMTLVLGGLALDRHSPADPGASLLASKRHGQVVFSVAGGGGDHRLYRSDDPQGSDGWEVLPKAGGAFRDRLQDGSDVVFYRID